MKKSVLAWAKELPTKCKYDTLRPRKHVRCIECLELLSSYTADGVKIPDVGFRLLRSDYCSTCEFADMYHGVYMTRALTYHQYLEYECGKRNLTK